MNKCLFTEKDDSICCLRSDVDSVYVIHFNYKDAKPQELLHSFKWRSHPTRNTSGCFSLPVSLGKLPLISFSTSISLLFYLDDKKAFFLLIWCRSFTFYIKLSDKQLKKWRLLQVTSIIVIKCTLLELFLELTSFSIILTNLRFEIEIFSLQT